jgi:hypothetical protein
MSATPTVRDSRRSTRVSLKVAIDVQNVTQLLTCDGETLTVNLHGALIRATACLRLGMKISIRVYMTDKHAKARVVYVDPTDSLRCGIELDQPRNIWGVSLPPADWDETQESEM